jgi:hypothetical protein
MDASEFVKTRLEGQSMPEVEEPNVPLSINWAPDLDHNVYILGAGFSSDGGMPLVSNFLERMAEAVSWLLEHERDDEAKAVGAVFAFRLRAAGAAYRCKFNVENIEELFSLASASASSSLSQHITTAIAATLEFCRNTYPINRCNVHISSQSSLVRAESNMPLYQCYADAICGKWSDDPTSSKNTVITFNYDTLLEEGLHASGIPFHYGEGLDYQPSSPCAYSPSNMSVYKLHGSVNWGTQPASSEEIKVYASYDEVLGNGERVVLLPPTWRKTFGGGLSTVWAGAVKALTTATRIIVLGFSMPPTDAHFKYLLMAGLQPNISLRRLFYINPGLDESTSPAESKRLKENLFSILRPELQERGTVEMVTANTMRFLFSGKSRKKIGRDFASAKVVVNVLGPPALQLE